MSDTDIFRKSRPSKVDRISAAILAGVFLLVAVGAAAYGLLVIAEAAADVIVAVITASATLFAAVFGYVFQRLKELELAAVQRRQELELQERNTKQENYKRVLEELAPFLRNPREEADAFTTAHLLTWVVGSPKVVMLTGELMTARNSGTLDNLLFAMRQDLEPDQRKGFTRPEEMTTKGLFPVPEPKGGLD